MSSGGRLAIETDVVEGIPVVRVRGEIDLYTVHEFETALESGLTSNPPALIADLTGASYLDSSGLSALLHVYKLISAQGGPLYVIASPDSPGVKRVLNITHLDTIFRVRDTMDDAAAEIRTPKAA